MAFRPRLTTGLALSRSDGFQGKRHSLQRNPSMQKSGWMEDFDFFEDSDRTVNGYVPGRKFRSSMNVTKARVPDRPMSTDSSQ